MIAKTIDEVVEQLDAIIDCARSENSRIGFFAALYQKVTIKVKEALKRAALWMATVWNSSM